MAGGHRQQRNEREMKRVVLNLKDTLFVGPVTVDRNPTSPSLLMNSPAHERSLGLVAGSIEQSGQLIGSVSDCSSVGPERRLLAAVTDSDACHACEPFAREDLQ
jgi:hypothetical protein